MKPTIGNFVLASLITSYPAAEYKDVLAELLSGEDIELDESFKALLQDTDIDSIRTEYIAVFDQAKSLNPLYETEYGRERVLFKANELADIAGFYRAFGFEMDQDGVREMVDHISVELEFYGLLMMKREYLLEQNDLKGCEIVFDAMKKFMELHLGRFSRAILSREGVQTSPYYKTIFEWVSNLIDSEANKIGVAPEPLAWLASQVEKEEVCCGATVGLNK